ncbi:MAG TPA: hypothetical protein VN026_07570 [Bacteroidia bacterium]|jgi:hypothetical protein|nr:hypothetical protein [Bacteroidia bacterium]
MKKLTFLILLFCGFISLAANKDSLLTKKIKSFNKELQFFMDTMNSKHSEDSQYLVFATKFYDSNDKKEEYCFTLGYILNSGEYSIISPYYYYYYKNNYVLIKIKEAENKKLIKQLGLKKITKEDSLKIINRLFPSENGGFSYRGKSIIFCNDKNKQTRTFYGNRDEIPFEKSILGPLPSGIKIEKIK